GDIAAGNIGAAADALEKGLATALKLVINFLAKFLRLDGITAKIRAAIQKLRDKVDKMLDRVVEWIVTKAKKLFARVFGKKDAAAAGPGAADDLVTRPFAMNGMPHTLEAVAQGGQFRLYMASRREFLDQKLDREAADW